MPFKGQKLTVLKYQLNNYDFWMLFMIIYETEIKSKSGLALISREQWWRSGLIVLKAVEVPFPLDIS